MRGAAWQNIARSPPFLQQLTPDTSPPMPTPLLTHDQAEDLVDRIEDFILDTAWAQYLANCLNTEPGVQEHWDQQMLESRQRLVDCLAGSGIQLTLQLD